MVLPDGVRGIDDEVPASSPRLPMFFGLGLLVMGALIIGLLTGSRTDESFSEVAPSPTTDHVDNQIRWEQVQTMEQATAFAILEFNDEVLAFTSAPLSEESPLTGLRVWRSPNGVDWQPGQYVVGAEGDIRTVASTALGIVALGYVPNDEDERAWLSVDGAYWLPLMDGLPLDTVEFRESVGLLDPDEASPVSGAELAFGRDVRVVTTAVIGDLTVALLERPPDRGRPYDLGTVEIWAAESP